MSIEIKKRSIYKDLSNLEAFMQAVETKSFSLAAEELHLTKSAISKSIKQLENTFELPLFLRNARHLELTPEGNVFYQHCLNLKAAMQRTQSVIRAMHHEPSGKLKLSVNPSLMKSLVVPVIAKYQQLFPKVVLEVLYQEDNVDMYANEIDIVIGRNLEAPDEIVLKKAFHSNHVLCATAEYIAKQGGMPQTIEDLQRFLFIGHINQRAMPIRREYPEYINQKLQMDSILAIKQAMLAGMGISQMHDYVVKQELESGELVHILPEITMPRLLYIYYQKHNYTQPKVQKMIDLITEELHQEQLQCDTI
ncbi:LysR family transcriptional regulator [Cysteiniphilum halobium]|uniref:LysR family transcriptional regulator n=1 Tax=Cysteiniphilum halobium TaxID=2219059 RepID=UPI000E6518F1|nr:LysR family transcriptional regulator [Cysteiniphilum halobium]